MRDHVERMQEATRPTYELPYRAKLADDDDRCRLGCPCCGVGCVPVQHTRAPKRTQASAQLRLVEGTLWHLLGWTPRLTPDRHMRKPRPDQGLCDQNGAGSHRPGKCPRRPCPWDRSPVSPLALRSATVVGERLFSRARRRGSRTTPPQKTMVSARLGCRCLSFRRSKDFHQPGRALVVASPSPAQARRDRRRQQLMTLGRQITGACKLWWRKENGRPHDCEKIWQVCT